MRIGVLGGSFDPPHVGHLQLARAAQAQLELEEVIFIPAWRNPLKGRTGASGAHRLAMVELLIAKQPGFSASNIELTRRGPSYTVETLEEIQAVRPGEYWFLIGSDAFSGFWNWKHPERILKLARLAFFARPDLNERIAFDRLPANIWTFVDRVSMPSINVSSTEIRDRIFERKPIDGLLSPEVQAYVREHRLYEDPND